MTVSKASRKKEYKILKGKYAPGNIFHSVAQLSLIAAVTVIIIGFSLVRYT